MITDYNLRLMDLRRTLKNTIEQGTTAIDLAKLISIDDQTISDRAIREFVSDKRRYLSDPNYDLVVNYYMHEACRFEHLNAYPDFVSTISVIASAFLGELKRERNSEEGSKTDDILKNYLYLDPNLTIGDDVTKEENFQKFLVEDVFFAWPYESRKADLQDVIFKYQNKDSSRKISFLEILSKSSATLDAFAHVKEMNLFDELFKHHSKDLFIYGNILPRYFCKGPHPQVYILFSTKRAFNPYVEHNETEIQMSGLSYNLSKDENGNEIRIPFLLRNYLLSDFFSPAIMSIR